MLKIDLSDVHNDSYPSTEAMAAAVELEIESAIGRVQTQTIGKLIQRVIKAERIRCSEIALAIDSGRGNEKEIANAILGANQ